MEDVRWHDMRKTIPTHVLSISHLHRIRRCQNAYRKTDPTLIGLWNRTIYVKEIWISKPDRFLHIMKWWERGSRLERHDTRHTLSDVIICQIRYFGHACSMCFLHSPMEAVAGASAAAADVVEAAGRRERVRRPRRYILPSDRSLRSTSRESLHWCCHFKEIGKVHLVS